MPGLSVRRPMLAAVMNLLIIIAGIAAVFGIEVRELPDIDRPIVSVRANYPGASPTTVDTEVTSLVEGAVARVAGVVAVSSSSEEGNFRMRVEFRPDRDIANAANDVREAVSRVVPRLPSGVDDLYVVKAERDAWPIMRVAVWSDSARLDDLTRRINKEIIPELTAVDGVADVSVFGGRDQVIRVEVLHERLAAFALSISDVVEVLKAAQFDIPIGSFEADQMEVLVRADATVIDPAVFEELTVRDTVRLADVADIHFNLATSESTARLDGRLVLNLGIVRQAQSNTVQISNNVREALDRLELRFPGLRFEITSDNAIFIRGAVIEVLSTLAVALFIVISVIWLFLGRIGATLVPAIAIPIALTGSLAAIWLLGYSINLITLLALVVATGLVVDDAIVVTENIQRCRSKGIAARAAAVIGTRQVFFAVIATTITLVAVFLPISFLPGDAGRLFAEFGVVLAVTVSISSFVALSACPMIAARLDSLGGDTGFGTWVGQKINIAYAAALRPILYAPLIALAVMGLIAATAVIVYENLGEELVPAEDRGLVNIWMQGPDGTDLDYTDRQVEAVEAMLTPWIENGQVESIYSITGRYDLNRGYVGAKLSPWETRTASQAEIEADLRPKLASLAGARAIIWSSNSLALRRGSNGGLTIAITGPDYPAISEAADEFARRMEDIPGLSRIRVQYQATQPQLSVSVDRERASDLDISMDALSETLRALIDEEEIVELNIGDQAVPIMLQPAEGAVRDPSDLLNHYVRSESGELIPLSQLVQISEIGVAAELDRHGQRRAIEIDATVDPELTLKGAVDQIRTLANDTLPEGMSLLLLGEAAALDETSNAITITYVIALLIVFLVLAAQFESLTSAAVIMVSVPFGVCAAIYALWLTGTTINIYSQIGVLMLIGIMAKNGILMVEFADQLRERGAEVVDAALGAATARLRPIAMTLASTALAGLPLILSDGPGAEARSAIGWVVFGGLGLAAGFTLFVTPAAYALIAGLSSNRMTGTMALEAEMEAAGKHMLDDRVHG